MIRNAEIRDSRWLTCGKAKQWEEMMLSSHSWVNILLINIVNAVKEGLHGGEIFICFIYLFS